MKNYLIVGATGTGKTWVMLQLLELSLNGETPQKMKFGLINYTRGNIVRVNPVTVKTVYLTGVYDGSTFQGSDRLSMAVMKDVPQFIVKDIAREQLNREAIVIWEGDRFTNQNFIREANPVILKILGDGAEGRKARGSSQTERQIKAIATRVSKVQANHDFANSEECLKWLLEEIDKP